MSGEELKKKLISGGVKISELPALLDTSAQNLSRALGVADVKTGFIEKLCTVLNKDLSFFYGETEFLPISIRTGGEVVSFKVYENLREKLQNEIYAYRDTIKDLKNQILLMQKGMNIAEIAKKEVV